MTPIHPLSPEIVSLMAAGEVIDSLAAVVRELAENALDAGATRIAISLNPERWQVRVADNGSGMTQSDLALAATAHSTSKIRTRSDLTQVQSLGFRGEALHSLAQLAQLSICSRSPGAAGWQVTYSAEGNAEQMTSVAIAPGTIVTVSDLFARWPARRQTPALTAQVKVVQAVVQALALCHPPVTWTVEQRDRPWFTLWPGTTAKTVLPQLLRAVDETDLQELHWPTAPPQSYLLVGLPDRCHRHRPDWVRTAINGRPVNSADLSQSLIQCFRQTLPRDRFPVCFLHLTVPPEQIDWNRHPAKTEIYLQALEQWRQQIAAAVERGLRQSDIGWQPNAQTQQASQVIKAAEQTGVYATPRSVEPEETDRPALPQSLTAIAQVHGRYILAEHASGLCLIEQHIAHERVLYEQLCQRWQMVAAEPPIILSQLLDAQVEQLQRLTLQVEPFGEQLWAVRSIPAQLRDRADCADALLELSLGADLESALVATACRTALRNGMPLTQPEMQSLLDQWQRSRRPRTCPHGRPICLVLEESSLARYFRRHWVIGKSHGI
ncbi:DNA mismatch repair endonuclease MutL [Romeria aff. gracilis LEGE 07310]|uniref:DNA mismatch repair protein MutL n=1 Tax=Vasconcelosia minhoensis LEGE 07310 TaxID=915328 RepID=A0A8J7DDP2_9CYAN|nr:DNA mismatch repair endonuclease MutL [Romeria gracilis]MBE9078998.1 DNA mismatch repair endonuclease MutL [Romeria aff. gracilis LEGE 07310]